MEGMLTDMSILKVEGLTVNYGTIRALHGVDLSVEKGEIITLIGANGAGKTTTMNSIMNLIPKAGGRVEFDGKDITAMPTKDIVKLGIILAPEGRQIFPDFTVRDNLLMGGYYNTPTQNDEEIAKVTKLFPILEERMKQKGGTLSGGEQQMLAIARALMARPKLLMLDEPSLGLAPLVISDIFRLLKEIREMGVTILLVEQNARMALKISDRGYALETGRITITDTSDKLLHSDAIIRAYLA